MKKKIMVIVMALVLSISMLASCGGPSKKDYEHEMDTLGSALSLFYYKLNQYNNGNITTDDLVDDLNDLSDDLVKKLYVQTPEGKQIQSDIQEIAELFEKVVKYTNQGDIDKIYDLTDDISDLFSVLGDHIEDFFDAARDSGVDEDDLEDFEDKIISLI